MARLVALDVGDVKIGVAESDPLKITAQPVGTFYRKNKDVPKELIEYLKRCDFERVIVGLPLNMNGSEGDQAKKTKKFMQQLCDLSLLNKNQINYVDERLSSTMAKQSLIALGKKPSRDKGAVDKIAAIILLQTYMGTY